jgi:hypothetical protein
MATARILKAVSVDACRNPYRIPESPVLNRFGDEAKTSSGGTPPADEGIPLKPQPVRLSETTANCDHLLT